MRERKMRVIYSVLIFFFSISSLFAQELKTSKDETILLTLPDGVVTIQENSSLEIISDNHLDLRVGEILVELKSLEKGTTFQVTTPVAVAGVRGTIFSLLTGLSQDQLFTEIDIVEGIVSFANLISQEKFLLSQDEWAIAYEDGSTILSYNERHQLEQDIQSLIEEIRDRQNDASKEETETRRLKEPETEKKREKRLDEDY